VLSNQASGSVSVPAQVFTFYELRELSVEQATEMAKLELAQGNFGQGNLYYNVNFKVPVRMDIILVNFTEMFTFYAKRTDFVKRPVKR
jgi:hypothetical protein